MQHHDDFDDLSSLSPTLSNFLADSEWAASFNSLGLDSEEQLCTHSEFQVKEEEEEEEVLTRVGHADASADAHRMRINAHQCASMRIIRILCKK